MCTRTHVYTHTQACSKGGHLLCCERCNVSSHRACAVDPAPARRDADDKDVETTWVCRECSREVDAVKHNADCEECNEFEYIFADIKQKIELLEELAPTQGEEEEPKRASNAKTYAAELTELRSSLEQYRAHLIRTKAQAYIKYDYMEHVAKDDTAWYSLADYWAKLTPTKSKEGTCEGTQAGISCHGTTFYYKNPSEAKRQEYYRLNMVTAGFFDNFPDPKKQHFVCENYQVGGHMCWCWWVVLLWCCGVFVSHHLLCVSGCAGSQQQLEARHVPHTVRPGRNLQALPREPPLVEQDPRRHPSE